MLMNDPDLLVALSLLHVRILSDYAQLAGRLVTGAGWVKIKATNQRHQFRFRFITGSQITA
jgi:hypothetical protein